MDLCGLKIKIVDVDGVVYERIFCLKCSRLGLKVVVIGRQCELFELMKNFDNVDQVRLKFFDLELVMRNFNEVYDKYYVELIDESVI